MVFPWFSHGFPRVFHKGGNTAQRLRPRPPHNTPRRQQRLRDINGIGQDKDILCMKIYMYILCWIYVWYENIYVGYSMYVVIYPTITRWCMLCVGYIVEDILVSYSTIYLWYVYQLCVGYIVEYFDQGGFRSYDYHSWILLVYV